jgi:hypothetical protein
LDSGFADVIDFRYHIVSLVAVFLALAAGVALGAGPLNTPIARNLTQQTQNVAKEKQQEQEKSRGLQDQINYDNSLTEALSKRLIDGKLAGRSAVIVVLPGANSLVDSVSGSVTRAGGQITGTVEVTEKYLDPSRATLLASFVVQLRPAIAAERSPARQIGRALAESLVTKDPTITALSEDAVSMLDGLAGKELSAVSWPDKPSRRATFAIVISPPKPLVNGDARAGTNELAVSLIDALDTASRGVVVGGTRGSADDGAALAAVRDSDAAKRVSSVDVLDSGSGLVTLDYALIAQEKGVVGHYGLGAGADSKLSQLLQAVT